MARTTVTVPALGKTLRDLRRYEPEMYKQITNRLKVAAQPLADKVGAAFPAQPLENWHKTGGRKGPSRMPPYSGSAVKRGTKPIVDPGRIRQTMKPSSKGILRIEQRNAGGAVYDAMGSKTPREQMVVNVDKHLQTKSQAGKTRSRVLYPVTKRNMAMIEREVQIAIRSTDALIQQQILKGN